MKTKILIVGLVLATVAAVVFIPSIRGHANGVKLAPAAVPQAQAARVDAVFVLDTTGSMSGLIAAAKEKIWSIAGTFAQAKQAPEIRIGLVAYRDRGDAYVTKTVDLSTDLDSMYATLMDFRADGGGDTPESVNQGLYDAVTKMSWSQDAGAYKVIFLVGDAPPHMDYQDDHKFPEVLAAARAKGIVVNTIQCGSMAGTAAPWQQIASLGGGRYFTVAQAGSAVAITTPYDKEMATLAARLDATRLYYGSREERKAFEAKIAATDKLHASASPAAQARRGAFEASASGAANLVGDKDLAEAVAAGTVDLATVPEADLPAPLVNLSVAERRKLVEKTTEQRDELRQRIGELAKQRDAFIADKIKQQGGAADSLDQQIYDAVREQAAPKGLKYEGGPKY
jgi:Mg-chelatase subunit ChlD